MSEQLELIVRQTECIRRQTVEIVQLRDENTALGLLCKQVQGQAQELMDRVHQLEAAKAFDNLLIKELREDREELSENNNALRERVRVLEETVARLRGHIDHEMLRVLDAKGLGGGKGEG